MVFERLRSPLRRRGAVIVYAVVMMIVLLVTATLAVDWGRAQMTKTELQGAADSAARYAITGLSTDVSTATSNAVYAASVNYAVGMPVVLNSSTDVEFGVWDPATKDFQVLTGTDRNSADAIRITARRSQVSATPLSVTFARALGVGSMNIEAVSIVSRGTIVTNTISAQSCLWLAGMPSGSQVAATGGNTTPAQAPANAPPQITNVALTPGSAIFFRQTTGTTSYTNASNYGPDGQTDWIVNQAAANGINSTKAPIMSLVGIFLDNRQPDSYAMPASLDFSTADSRNFQSLSPQLKQVFFIGDGLDDSGNLQKFIVPSGTTRLYLGIMDENGWWWDNTGQIQSTMMDDTPTLVK